MVQPGARAMTPTWVRGRCKHVKIRSRGTVRGFTLIEVMVVVLIMGLFAGLVSVVLRPDHRGPLPVEAERLAQVLDLAALESQLTGTQIAWVSDGTGYRFWRMAADARWSEVRDNDVLRARALPAGMTISDLKLETARSQGGLRLEFTPYGPPPVYRVEMAFGAARCVIAGSPMGEVQILPECGVAGDGSATA